MKKNNSPAPFIPYLCEPTAILGLILVGELLALVLVLANRDGFSWQYLGSVSLIAQWIILSCALLLCQSRNWLNTLPVFISGFLSYLICLITSGVILYLAHLISIENFNIESWLKGVLISAILSGILLRYLYVQQQLHNQRQSELEARLQALQSRIRPHFLFNSMNTIISLISINPSAAEKAVENLSQLFRSNLQDPGLIYLEEEIDICRRYIAIEELRLGDRLKIKWIVDDPIPHIKVPSLLLQPLLENAIIHGVQRITAGGEIKLIMTTQAKSLSIIIENPIPSLEESQIEGGNKIALDNIKNRLLLHYENQAAISTIINAENYSVKISIPLIPAQKK